MATGTDEPANNEHGRDTMTKRFAALDSNNILIRNPASGDGLFDSRDSAAGACQDAAREAGSDSEGYEVKVALRVTLGSSDYVVELMSDDGNGHRLWSDVGGRGVVNEHYDIETGDELEWNQAIEGWGYDASDAISFA